MIKDRKWTNPNIHKYWELRGRWCYGSFYIKSWNGCKKCQVFYWNFWEFFFQIFFSFSPCFIPPPTHFTHPALVYEQTFQSKSSLDFPPWFILTVISYFVFTNDFLLDFFRAKNVRSPKANSNLMKYFPQKNLFEKKICTKEKWFGVESLADLSN